MWHGPCLYREPIRLSYIRTRGPRTVIKRTSTLFRKSELEIQAWNRLVSVPVGLGYLKICLSWCGSRVLSSFRSWSVDSWSEWAYLGAKIYEMHKIITQYFRCNFGNHSRRRIQRCQRIHFCCSFWYLPLFITFDIISSITKSHVRVNTISINGVSKTRTVETYVSSGRFSPGYGNHHSTSLFQKWHEI